MSLAVKTVRGAIWNIAGSIGGRSIGLVGSLVLASLLAPAEYGVANIAFVLVSSVNVFTYLGFGQYLVATPDAGDDVAFHATFFNTLIGVLALLGVVMLSHPIGRLFDAPGLVWIIPGMALAGGLERIAYIPARILVREMRFRMLGIRQVAGEITYAATAVVLALHGWGALAIVVGNIARAAVGLVLLVSVVERASWLTVVPLRWATTRKMLQFGVPLSVGNILYFASSRWDNLLIAKLFGPGVVGQYNLAYNLADVPAMQVGEQVGDALLPSFTRMTDEATRVRALARAAGQLALVIFPMAVGLAAVAPTLQATFLKESWSMVGAMLAILSVLSVVRPIGWLISSYLQAGKRTGLVMWLEALKAVSVLSFIPLFGLLGPIWACVAVGVAFATYALASVWCVHRLAKVPAQTLLEPLVRPLLSCVPMALCVFAARQALGSQTPAGYRLGLEVLVGVVGYGLTALLVASEEVREMRRLVAQAMLRS
jgi:PST family polysaccharide transporter